VVTLATAAIGALPVETALLAGGVAAASVFAVTTLVPTAMATILQGASAQMFSNGETPSDFSAPMAFFGDAYTGLALQEAGNAVSGLTGEGGEIMNTIVDTAQGFVSLVDPNSPSSVTSEVVDDFSNIEANLPKSGSGPGTPCNVPPPYACGTP
jgi:hypothetical protein